MDWFLYDNGLRHERVKWLGINSCVTEYMASLYNMDNKRLGTSSCLQMDVMILAHKLALE